MAAPPASEPYVFLSYASVDRERALALADALGGAGVSVWLDRRSIPGGSSWDSQIVAAIKDCVVFALTCTGAALRSRNVGQEIRLAWEFDRPILPVLLEAVEIPEEIKYPLAGRQWIELIDRPADEWLPALRGALSRLGLPVRPGGAAALAAEPATPPSEPPARATEPRPTLPAALTSFIGRESERADVRRLLDAGRLVTLTGPGGSGKTRLALAVAERMQAPDGVWFVDLSAVGDPKLVAPAIAQALGVHAVEGQPLSETLAAVLRAREALLLLDNFEQVVEAAPLLRELLTACPRLRMLVTSRTVLHLSGEREYTVPPLPLPPQHATPDALAENPAVALFVERAQAVRPDFVITQHNAADVAGICRRLDRLPLAIELAAARVKLLSPEALLPRLEQGLKLLSGGSRDLPRRQQTLRDTIQWSFDLLSPAEQALFRRLSVFGGGCSLEAAETVCDADADLGLDILDGLASLVDKSLVQQADGAGGGPRFTMLTTIREFAAEQLTAANERGVYGERHARFVLAGVRRETARLRGPEAGAAQERLAAETDDIRAALSWCVEANDAALGSRLLWALTFFWIRRGLSREGLVWAERLLNISSAQARTMSRGRILLVAADQASQSGNLPTFSQYAEECVAISRELGDTPCLAQALRFAGMAYLRRGELAAARTRFEESLTLLRGLGDHPVATAVMGSLSIILFGLGDLEGTRILRDEAVSEVRAVGDPWLIALTLVNRGLLAEAAGDDEHARSIYGEARQLFDRIPSGGSATVLGGLARLALRRGDGRQAAALANENLDLVSRRGGLVFGLLEALEDAITVLLFLGEVVTAARLGGAVAAEKDRQGALTRPELRAARAADLAAIRAALDEEAFAAAWVQGSALAMDSAVALAQEALWRAAPVTDAART